MAMVSTMSAVLSRAVAIAGSLLAAAAVSAQAVPAAAEEFPAPAGFYAAYRQVDDVKLHYVSGGSGPLVLLVHGFGQTWYEWRQLMPLLAATHTVVAVDLPSLGLSSPPRSYVGQDVAALLYKFAKSLSPQLPFDLVAHDIGIWNTYPMVADHQADIRRVVFMEAGIPDERLYQSPGFTPAQGFALWHHSFFSEGELFPERLISGNERFFVEHFIKSHATNKAVFHPGLLDGYGRSYAKPQSLHGGFEYYRALNETARRNNALASTRLTMPVLAIGGDGSMGPEQGRQLGRYATNVKAAVLQGCGHWLPEECADALNPLVIDFLSPN